MTSSRANKKLSELSLDLSVESDIIRVLLIISLLELSFKDLFQYNDSIYKLANIFIYIIKNIIFYLLIMLLIWLLKVKYKTNRDVAINGILVGISYLNQNPYS